MEYRPLGASGLKVSVLGLGSMTWGCDNTPQQAFEQLDLACDAGVNLIDTAEIYPVPPEAENYGGTETIIGNWLNSRKRRSEIVLATKVAGHDIDWIREGKGFKKPAIRTALEGSLRRLKTDYVDIYQLHWPQRRVPLFGVRNYHGNWCRDDDGLTEALEQLDPLVRAGKIRAVGLSNETAWGLMRALEVAKQLDLSWPIASVQNSYSLINRRDEYHLSECLLRERVGYLGYSPLAGGMLSGKYRNQQLPPGSRFAGWGRKSLSRYLNPNVDRAVAAYAALAEEHQLEPVTMVMAFTCQQPFVSSVLVGATSTEQLQSSLAGAELQLAPELSQKIENIYRKHPDPAC